MPNIKDTLVKLNELPNLGLPTPSTVSGQYTPTLEPPLNSQMRCPLPPVTVSPDSLRQFYRGGQLPQTRVLSPPPLSAGGTSTTTGGTAIVEGGSGGGSTTNPLVLAQTAVTTNVLSPGRVFTGLVSLGHCFQLVSISTSVAARVELYGTFNALQIDAIRPIDVAPPFGTEQGIILDVVLDQSPFNWTLEGITGNNGDNPNNNFVYIAVTNVGLTTNPIIVTLIYLPFIP